MIHQGEELTQIRKSPGKPILSIVAIIFLSALFVPAVKAEEKILSFHSDVTVNENASLLVRETIRVVSEGQKITHGIYRDFPVKYKEGTGKIIKVGFHVAGVKRDGRPDKFRETEQDNGVRVYIGDPAFTLPPGQHEYELTYTTDHQLGFFEGYDELYWNVTGNGWYFDIEKASALIHLPADAGSHIINTAGYTGTQGSTDQNYISNVDPSGAVRFETTGSLSSYEGLTVAVSWPKGYVRPEGEPELLTPPTEWNKVRKQLMPGSMAGTKYALFGLLVLSAYYGLVWLLVGKDPEEGVIVVRYEPPAGLSPAVMRYIAKMGYDDKAFSSALINMAVKGFITIIEEGGDYTIRKREGGKTELSLEESKAYQELFGARSDLKLEQANHTYIRAAIRGMTDYLKKKFEKLYFVTNSKYFIAGLLITCVLLLLSGFSEAGAKGAVPIFIFICIWLTGWSVGVIMLLRQVVSTWRSAFVTHSWNRLGNAAGAIFMTCFALPFVGGEAFGLYILTTSTSFVIALFLVLAMMVNYLFFHLLKAPTGAGRKILDQIEGFKRFLSATGADRMNVLTPADRTPQLFEKYLPYALALDVEQQWSEQFADVLASAAVSPGQGRSGPAWYSGSSWNSLAAAGFAASLGSSFSNAISSSSTAPGSSSGSGGGGSSGGGGGGGGGGGW